MNKTHSADIQLFDTHCHFDFPAFDGHRKSLVDDCLAGGVLRLLIPATTRASWDGLLELVNGNPSLFRAALGLHPYFTSEHRGGDLEALASYLERHIESCVAVGEMGLDASRERMDDQERFFIAQLELARAHNKPAIVHSFKTHSRVIRLIKDTGVERGVIHAFSGSMQEAESFASLGWKLGVGPILTWPRATKTRRTIAGLPLESLVLETDAPDMCVDGGSKGQGRPRDLVQVFHALCAIRDESPAEIARVIWSNSQDLFA